MLVNMPTSIRISKEMILETAFKIVKKEGMEGLSIRKIADTMGSSIRPMYYQFKNMDELKLELMGKIESYFYQFITKNMTKDMPEYKQTGINYIKFAKEEPNLFKILYTSDRNATIDDLTSTHNNDYINYQKIVKNSTHLNDIDVKTFHLKMWIFTHGLAMLIANKTCNFSDEQISQLLSDEYKALMLLEKKEDIKNHE